MSRTLVALLGLSSLAAVSARTHHNDPVPGQFVTGENVADEFQARQMFNDFQVKFQRNYADTNETEYRYSVFRMNLLKIAILNDRNGKPAFGVNGFSDLTEEEFKKGYLGYKPAKPGTLKWNKRLETPVSVNGKITKFYDVASVDWRTKGAVTPVKDQGQCGSCWAFSATEETESMWFLGGNGPLPVLAPQQVVSCDTVDQGCNGGDTPTAYQYIESNGLEPETDYPYSSGAAGVTGSCSYNQNDVVVKIKGYTYATPPCTDSCTSQDEKTLAANLAATGPASICVNAAAWQSYTSGILTASACGSSAYTSLDHCVQLVGYQTDATTGQKYWLVRNSWNTVWGNVGTADAGYIYLEYGTNACGVADEATFVTV